MATIPRATRDKTAPPKNTGTAAALIPPRASLAKLEIARFIADLKTAAKLLKRAHAA